MQIDPGVNIDLTIGLWQLLAFAGVVGAFLVNQYIVLRSVQKWANDHEQTAKESMKVLSAMVTDMARVTQRLDGMEKRMDRLDRLEQEP